MNMSYANDLKQYLFVRRKSDCSEPFLLLHLLGTSEQVMEVI